MKANDKDFKKQEKLTVVQAAIVDGILDLLKRFKLAHNGRYNHEEAIAHQVLLRAATWKCGDKNVSLRDIAEVLETRTKTVLKAAREAKAISRTAVNNSNTKATVELPSLFKLKPSSAGGMAEDHELFVIEMWDELTRASECKRDEVRNPKLNPETLKHDTHRIHWIETKHCDILEAVIKAGKVRFDENFTVSSWK